MAKSNLIQRKEGWKDMTESKGLNKVWKEVMCLKRLGFKKVLACYVLR